MHTRASNPELVEPLAEPERTFNRKLRRKHRKIPFERRHERPQQPKTTYPHVEDINLFRYFLKYLENPNPMDDDLSGQPTALSHQHQDQQSLFRKPQTNLP